MKLPNFKNFCIKLYIYYVPLGLEHHLRGTYAGNVQKTWLITPKIGNFEKKCKKGVKKVTACEIALDQRVFAFS